MDLLARRMLVVLFTATAILTFAGFLLKAQCINHFVELRFKNVCSNDLQMLYDARGMHSRQFPYVHGDLVDHQLVGGAIEYPVLTGFLAWLPALLVHDDGGYLQVTALFLMPFTFLSVWLLSRMVRWRALIYALAPPLVWYSFHNFDLPITFVTIAACYAWWRQRYALAGALLAAGACLKLWPIFLMAPLLLDLLGQRAWRSMLRTSAASAGVLLALNLPIALISPRGWWAPYAFQQERAADNTTNSIWFWALPDLTTDQLNMIVPALLLLGITAACLVGRRRAEREGVFPFIQVSAAILVVFLLTNKAHSPQYMLWLLPFFCLIELRWGWWVTYLAFDTTLYLGLFRWYYDLNSGRDMGFAKQATIVGVWGRIVMLVLLFVVILRAKTALVSTDERTESEAIPAYRL